MAASYLVLVCRVNNLAAQRMAELIKPGTMDGKLYGRSSITNAARLLEGCAAGARAGNVWATVIDDSGTKATGNIACTRANAAGNYVRFTFGTKTITLTEGTDFLRGASDTTCAANLATAINAHATLGRLMTAAGAVGDCGLTFKFPTAIPHDIALSTDDATAFSFTQPTGATEGAAQFFLTELRTQRTP